MKSFTLEMTDPAPWPSGQSGFSNPRYTVATHLVEVKSGQDFGTFLEERFFKPLDMASTTLIEWEQRQGDS